MLLKNDLLAKHIALDLKLHSSIPTSFWKALLDLTPILLVYLLVCKKYWVAPYKQLVLGRSSPKSSTKTTRFVKVIGDLSSTSMLIKLGKHRAC